jgi:hypothetical protein
MSAKKIKERWMSEIRERQEKKKWAGKRVWRGGLLYEIEKDNADDNKMVVFEVAHQQREEWRRDYFLSLGLREERRDSIEAMEGGEARIPPVHRTEEVDVESDEDVEMGIRQALGNSVRNIAGSILAKVLK